MLINICFVSTGKEEKNLILHVVLVLLKLMITECQNTYPIIYSLRFFPFIYILPVSLLIIPTQFFKAWFKSHMICKVTDDHSTPKDFSLLKNHWAAATRFWFLHPSREELLQGRGTSYHITAYSPYTE